MNGDLQLACTLPPGAAMSLPYSVFFRSSSNAGGLLRSIPTGTPMLVISVVPWEDNDEGMCDAVMLPLGFRRTVNVAMRVANRALVLPREHR